MSETQAFERDRYPAGVPCWVDIARRDPDAAADFYGGLFGWRFVEQSPPGASRYLIARIRGRDVAGVGSETSEGPSAPAWRTYVATDDADETARRVREAGGRVLVDPVDVGDAGRMAVCSDPSGATFSIWRAGRRTGAQLVNEPGTWNFSELNTDDRDGAEAFYGAVFGWELNGFGDEAWWFGPLAHARVRRLPRRARSHAVGPPGRPRCARGIRGRGRMARSLI